MTHSLLHLSSTDIGNRFRDAVAALLRSKYQIVDTEKTLGGHALDIYVEQLDFGRPVKIGFECKYYEKPLTKTYIAEKIFKHYDHLLQYNFLDYVVIIANKDIGKQAKDYLRSLPRFRFRTYEELQEDIIGIGSYITSLSKSFESDPSELSSYFVPTRLRGAALAAAKLDTWLEDPASPALAILGGYGTGKTSFAKFYAAERAKRFIADSRERMPILVPIGSEVYETKLESVFGRFFSSRHWSNNFRFETLETLNKEGRLLIIFDGFDEMKHAMTSSDFRANFREINRLVTGRAKILMLGRPNALPAEERLLVFRGQRKIKDQYFKADDWPVWEEVEIDFLTQAEIESFLERYLARRGVKQEALPVQIKTIMDKVDFDLLKRPIQLRLLAVLSLDPKVILQGITEYHVYYYFIQNLLERDMERRARNRVSLADREKFQRRLAFWSWTRRDRSFARDEIPPSLYDDIEVDDAIDENARINELIVTTLTEEKDLGRLFFGHRSLQEYLVAEFLRLSEDPQVFLAAYRDTSPEVRDFLRAGDDIGFCRRVWREVAKADPEQSPKEFHQVADFLIETSFFSKHFLTSIYLYDLPKTDQLDPGWNIIALDSCSAGQDPNSLASAIEREAVRAVIYGNSDSVRALGAFLLLRQSDIGRRVDLMMGAFAARMGRRLEQGGGLQMKDTFPGNGRSEFDFRDGVLRIRDVTTFIMDRYAYLEDKFRSRVDIMEIFNVAMDGRFLGDVTLDPNSYAFAASLRLDKETDFIRKLGTGAK